MGGGKVGETGTPVFCWQKYERVPPSWRQLASRHFNFWPSNSTAGNYTIDILVKYIKLHVQQGSLYHCWKPFGSDVNIYQNGTG